MKKRVISLLLVAAMTVGLVACGSNGGDSKKSDSSSSDEKILSVEVGPDPETVDPALNAAIDGGEMILHSFEGLLKLDENGDPEAAQAEKWEVSDDGLTYTRCEACMKICLREMPPVTQFDDVHYTQCWLNQKEAMEKGEANE